MNGVDVADQLRSYYNTQQTVRRNWMPLFFWLLDTAIVNSYRIARTLGSVQEQKEFRHELVWELIKLTNDTKEVRLRNCLKKEIRGEPKKEIRPKVTKNFELPNQRLYPETILLNGGSDENRVNGALGWQAKEIWIWIVNRQIKVSFGV